MAVASALDGFLRGFLCKSEEKTSDRSRETQEAAGFLPPKQFCLDCGGPRFGPMTPTEASVNSQTKAQIRWVGLDPISSMPTLPPYPKQRSETAANGAQEASGKVLPPKPPVCKTNSGPPGLASGLLSANQAATAAAPLHIICRGPRLSARLLANLGYSTDAGLRLNAGSGKTTLVADFLRTHERQFCFWYQLDHTDAEPRRFFWLPRLFGHFRKTRARLRAKPCFSYLQRNDRRVQHNHPERAVDVFLNEVLEHVEQTV